MEKLQNLIKNHINSYIILFLVIFLIYAQTFAFHFTHMDDGLLILDNADYLQNLGNIPKSFLKDVFMYPDDPTESKFYRPLLTVSLILDAAFSGTDPAIYHFTNVVLHTLATILLYHLLLSLKQSKKTSLLLSLLFAVHTSLTQTIAWIPGRNDTLLAVFSLITIISFIKLLNNKTSKTWLTLHSLSLLAAFFTKETALVLLPLLYLYAKYVSDKKLSKTYQYLLFFSWGIISTIWFFLMRTVTNNPLSSSMTFNVIKQALQTSVYFFSKLLIPNNLSTLPTIQPSMPLYALLTAAILITLTFFARKELKPRLMLFGLLWSLLFIIPAQLNPNIDPNLPFHLFEHRLYLALIGILIFFSGIQITKLLDNSKPALYLTYLIIIFLATKTLTYAPIFKNELSFWQHAASTSPNLSYTHYILGQTHRKLGNFTDSENEFFEALKLNPQEHHVRLELGNLYYQLQQLDKADKFYLEEISVNPQSYQAYTMLGILHYNLSNEDKAEKYLLKAISLNQHNPFAYKQLIQLYKDLGDTEKTKQYEIEAYRLGLTID